MTDVGISAMKFHFALLYSGCLVLPAFAADEHSITFKTLTLSTEFHAEGAAIAKAKGIPLPAEPDARHQAAAKELEQLSGERFDIAYMEQMVKGHVEALQLLERAYAEIDEQDLRAHAQQGIPLVRQHLDQARRIAGELVG